MSIRLFTHQCVVEFMCVVGGITAIRIVLLQLFEEIMSVVGGITKRVV